MFPGHEYCWNRSRTCCAAPVYQAFGLTDTIAYKVVHQKGNIFQPRAQRWYPDRKHIQAIVQVVPKCPPAGPFSSRFRFVATISRKSTGIGVRPPIRSTVRVSVTCSNLGCAFSPCANDYLAGSVIRRDVSWLRVPTLQWLQTNREKMRPCHIRIDSCLPVSWVGPSCIPAHRYCTTTGSGSTIWPELMCRSGSGRRPSPRPCARCTRSDSPVVI